MDSLVLGDPIEDFIKSILVALVKGDVDRLEKTFAACKVTAYRVGEHQVRIDIVDK